jgi:hypothetical protein
MAGAAYSIEVLPRSTRHCARCEEPKPVGTFCLSALSLTPADAVNFPGRSAGLVRRTSPIITGQPCLMKSNTRRSLSSALPYFD